ncbi:MAG: murein biosynthesis integral membrane protein MurJ [Gammaproteobacteria bacterium]|nr:murein biosynthesis integral membrane protein MurJ [Gammaproteobacteria bacterium]
MESPPPAEPAAGRSGLLRSTGVVGGMTLISRVLGLVRDVVFARIFGAGIGMDAFFVANKIPNMLRRFFAEGAFAQAFVPVFTDYRTTRGEAETRALADAVTGVLSLVLFVVTLVGVLAAPVLVFLVAPGFTQDGARFDLSVDMLRWTFPYLLFISLTALAGGMLNSHGRFAVPAFTPVLLNVVLIVFAVWVSPHWTRPEMALAVGVFVAGLVQLGFQLPALARIRMLPRPRLRLDHPGVRRIGVLILPAIFGSSVAQINVVFDNIIASFLQAGSVSWLYYADRLMEFPLGVFGIALATVILPGLSAQHAQRSREGFASMLDYALRLVLLIGVPATAGLAVLATPLVATLFFGGEFAARDVGMASVALGAYAAGLLGFILVKVLAPGYFSRQDTRTPVRVGVIALAVNMVLNVVFVVGLLRLGFDAPHAGLALATSLAALLNATLLYRGLRREGVYWPGSGWPALLLRIGLSVAAMVFLLGWLRELPGDWLALSVWGRIGWLALAVVGGAVCYFVVLFASGFRPAQLHGKTPDPSL